MALACGKLTKSGVLTFVVTLTLCATARAQLNATPAISESELKQPWEQHLAVLQSLPDSALNAEDTQYRDGLVNALSSVESQIGEFEGEVDEVINRIAGDPQFIYVAEQASYALSQRLAKVHTQFGVLYTTLAIEEREDVRSAQASLDALRDILQKRQPFERDLLNAFGSGSSQQIIGVMTRWWYGEEQAIRVKNHLSQMRQQLDGGSADGESN